MVMSRSKFAELPVLLHESCGMVMSLAHNQLVTVGVNGFYQTANCRSK